MLKITASLLILGFCFNFCYGATPVPTSQSIYSYYLESDTITVYNVSTNAQAWNEYVLTPPGTTGVYYENVIFGSGFTNDTTYAYGIVTGTDQITGIQKRELNSSDSYGLGSSSPISITIPADSNAFKTAVAPGYLAILTWGTGGDGVNNQVYLTIISGNEANPLQITSTADVTDVCTGTVTHTNTATSFILGNIWYDIGAGAFFYTYTKELVTTECVSGVSDTPATTYTIYLGGHFVNAAAYWTIPGLSLTPISAGNAISNLIGGGDNWVNSSSICVVYKDSVTKTIYSSWTTKERSTTIGGNFQALISDDTTTDATKTYTPLSVWASNYTYGIAVACANQTSASVYNYPILNFLNGSTTANDSGLLDTSVTDSSGGAVSLSGWMLNTGYTLVGAWKTYGSAYYYQFATFYANGAYNTTNRTIGYIRGPVNFYDDVNGAMWVGWTDIDTANSMTYAGFVAKLQAQIYPTITILKTNYYFVGIVLITLTAIIAHNLSSIWS